MDVNRPGKHPSEVAVKKWRKERFRRTRKYESRFSGFEEWRTTFSLVKTHRRRFLHEPVLEKQSNVIKKKSTPAERLREIKENVPVQFYIRAALRYMDYQRSVTTADFMGNPDKLASMVHNNDIETLQLLGGVDGIAEAVDVWMYEGVESSDLSTRQEIYGINKYGEKPSKSFLMFVWEALQDLTLIIIIVCSVVSVGMGVATKGCPDGIYEGLGILLSILLVVTITSVSDYNQSLQFKDHDKDKKEIFSVVTREGLKQMVSNYMLVVGDVVHLLTDDQVPADGILISGNDLLIDESSLTGASDPVHISEKKPFLLAGTIVQHGSATMLVTAVGMRTKRGKLMETLNEEGEDKTFLVLQVKVNGVATVIGKIGWVLSVLTFLVLTVRFLVGKAIRNEFSSWSSSDALSMLGHFATAITIIVAAVTKGLPLAVTLSLAFAMKKLRNDKAWVRNLSACGAMSFCTCICVDKSVTLTTNRIVVDKVFISGETEDVRDSEGRVLSPGLSESVLAVLLQGIFKCTDSEVVKDADGRTFMSGSPTGTAMLQYGIDLGGDFDAVSRDSTLIKIDPFSPTNKKKMSVIVTLRDGQERAFCKGAPEVVLGLCDKMIDVRGKIVPMSEEKIKVIANVIDEFAVDALRPLCLAYLDIKGRFGTKDDIPERGYTLIAVFGIKDPLRLGVKEAVETCLAAGISVRMVTRDDINTAEVIAKECGILTDGGLAIEGPDFRTKTPWGLYEIVPRIQVLARSSPTNKHEFVKHLKGMSEFVAVAGEGTIDAPALKESDIGFAMGIAGTEVAKGQADVILMDDDFATIVEVTKWGRAVYVNIQKFVQFQFTINMVALMLNFVSACITGSAPLTAVQLLWVNLIINTLGALALATEPPNDCLMKQPPVRHTDSFITKMMWRNIFFQSVYQMAVLFVFNFAGKPILNLHGPHATSILNTFIFNTFVFCQVFNEINSRDIDEINVLRGMFSSWIFMGVMILTIVFQVIIVEFLGTFASTVPLDWQLWVLSIVIGFVGIPISFVLKCKFSVKEQYNGYEILPDGPEAV